MNKRRTAASMPCPCDERRPYAQCCAPLHMGIAVARSAEALMRSRYSAYARGDVPYLLQTWHAATRPPALELDVATRWLGLKIIEQQTQADRATVRFIARWAHGGGSAQRLQELSRFVLEDGRWYYVDGDTS